MGTETELTVGCSMVRLTIDDDVCSDKGHEKALRSVRVPNCRLWASMPCIGGSQWNVKNYKKGSAKTRAKIDRHREKFAEIWGKFVEVARECLNFHPSNVVCIEWPNKCTYWELEHVQAFLHENNFIELLLHGCAYGLVGQNRHKGKPILKPWRVATTAYTDSLFLSKRCPGHRKHAVCEGDETRATEEYTWPLVNAVHRAHVHHVNEYNKDVARKHTKVGDNGRQSK